MLADLLMEEIKVFEEVVKENENLESKELEDSSWVNVTYKDAIWEYIIWGEGTYI